MKTRNNVALPHQGVCARLHASKIHGVGVFAIRDISKGTYIFPDDDEELIWIHKSDLGRLSAEERKLYDDFCILKDDVYGCPRNFNRLTRPGTSTNRPHRMSHAITRTVFSQSGTSRKAKN